MAKPIPDKRSVKERRVIKEQMEIFEKATQARYRIALATYDIQDSKTKLAIDTIRDRLATFQTGYMRVYPNGKHDYSVPVTIRPELIDQNVLYMAIEIVKGLAFMDIQVENFQFGKVYCADCGDKLTPRKKVK